MIKKTTICCLVFLMLLTSIQPVFAQESTRPANTEADTQRLVKQSRSDRITEISNTEIIPNKTRNLEVTDRLLTPSQTEFTATEITREPALDEHLEQNLDLSDTTINPTSKSPGTLENTNPTKEIPQGKNLQVDMVLKNKEDRQPLKGETFKLQADTFTGALTFEYPIQIPPGRNGLQPDLSLIYNSQNTDNDNIFGYGWSINIPYIERINKKGTYSMYYSNSFSSSMDGELEDISLTDGTHGTYGAKIENGDFLKYEYKNNGSWEVRDKSGLVYKFGVTTGANSGARQHDPNDFTKDYKWMLEEVRDTNDNFIKYEYLYDEGQIYPSKIKYTGNGNTDGLFSVEFLTKTRTDQNISYKPGFKVNTKYLISGIKKSYADSTSQQYNLEYQTGDNGKRSILTKITEQGNENAWQNSQLPSDKFDYQKNTGTWTKNANYTGPYIVPVDLWNSYKEMSGARIFDINGDAFPDIVFAKQGQPAAVYTNKGDDTGWQQNSSYSVPIYFVDQYGQDLGVRIGDVNGDHLEDLLYASPDTKNSYGVVKGKVYLNQGNDKGWSENSNYDFPSSITFISQYNADTGVRIADINGDGLADIVGTKIGEMYLNKGDNTGWTEANYGIYTKPPTGSTLADVNGDGLVDSISAQAGGPREVYINTGKDWQLDNKYFVPVDFITKYGSDNSVRIDDANGDGLPDIFHAKKGEDTNNHKVYINKGDGTGWEVDLQYVIPEPLFFEEDGVRLTDVNGDGLADFVSRNDILNNIGKVCCSIEGSVYTYPGKISDLLNSFLNNKGGSSKIDYLASPHFKDTNGKLSNPRLPFLIPLVQKIYNFDGLSGSVELSYQYESGEFFYKNPLERKFAGFKIISEKNTAGYITKNYYHQGNATEASIGEWDWKNSQFGDAVPRMGKLFAIEKFDQNNNLYSKTFQRWNHSSLGNDRDFVRLEQMVAIDYDGNKTNKTRAEKYSYDLNNGNLIQQISMGEVQVSDDILKQGSITSDLGTDKFTVDISYAQDSNKKISLPALEITKDQNSNKISETQIFYDNLPLFSATKGNITKQSSWISGNKYSSNTKNYNNYGLITQDTNPLGNITTYEYDSYNLYPIKITNALNQSGSYTYDYSSGGVKQYIDPNGSKIETIYDIFDRPKEIKHQDSANPAVMVSNTTYDYYDNVFPSYFTEWKKLDGKKGPISYSYFDGLGRIIQTRQELEDGGIFSVKDFKYNNLGLPEKESLPYVSNGGSKTSATSNDNLYIKYNYDPLNRVKAVQNAVGTTTYNYDDWKTTIKDAENNSKDYYNDAYGNLTKVVEYNEGANYTTQYQYNGLNLLTKLTDALGNIQTFGYDGLGRRTSMQALHSATDTTFGTYSFTYDDANNLTGKTDANGQTINYGYDKLNRPISEDFTGQTGVETSYQYDNCSNGIGKLCSATEGNVITSYNYNLLGQTISEKITLDSKDYLTQLTYDFQNNPLTMTYPDGTVNNYGYNMEGKLKTLKHQGKDIIKNINYSPIGAIEKIEYANGTTTTNAYDPQKLYRLSDKETKFTNPIQKLNYTYDKVGDITQIIDSSKKSDSTPAAIAKTATYQYDNLYRLKSANITNTGNNQNYSQNYTYNSIGNILSKTGQEAYTYTGNTGTSYATPHAVTNIGTAILNYDKNGNLLSDGKQTYKWDYKDRMIESSTSGKIIKYLYDHKSDRIKKSDGQNWTAYINKFYEIRNGEIVKHIEGIGENFATIQNVNTTGTPSTPTDPPQPTPTTGPNEIVYEDAEDLDVLGWTSYVGPNSVATNVYDSEKKSNVISLSPNSVFSLTNEDGTYWNDEIRKIFSIDVLAKQNFTLLVNVTTNNGDKKIMYQTAYYPDNSSEEHIPVALGASLKDGKWHNITLDLQADLGKVQPNTTISKVQFIEFITVDKVDNVKLLKPSTGTPSTPTDPPQPTPTPTPTPTTTNTIVYEDAEDGKTLGWKAYNSATNVLNSYENEKQGKVIVLKSPLNYGGFQLNKDDETYWNNETYKFLNFDINSKNNIQLALNIETSQGNKYLEYNSNVTKSIATGNYIYIKFESSLLDGNWHTITRDLQADISSVSPGTTLNKINYLQILWSGTTDNIKLDNIKLLKSLNPVQPPAPATLPTDAIVYEDAEDGDTLGWKSYYVGTEAQNIFDNEKQSKVINLPQGGFSLRAEDGQDWNNSTHKFFSLDVKSKDGFGFCFILEITSGMGGLCYSAFNYSNKANSSIVFINLANLKDENWHTITRDLQADFNSIKPKETINKIKFLDTFQSGKYDNIKLMKSLTGSSQPTTPPKSDPSTPNPSPSGTTIQTIYHHTDHLSGTSIETDEKGNVIEMTDYYPFGEIRVDQSFTIATAANGTTSSTPTSTGYKNPYKFTGKELDTDIGLYYYGARYYNPAIGRFVSMDPWEGDIKDPQSLNKYSYVINNPLRYTDPTGKFLESFVDGLVTLYDGAKTIKNIFESAIDGTALLWNLYVEKDYEDAANYANSYESNIEETKEAATDLALDIGATAIPFVPAGLSKVDDITKGTKNINKVTKNTKEIKSLKDSIKSLKKQITEHKQKIKDLKSGKYQIDSSKVKGDPEKYKKGLPGKWKNEIKNYKNLIKNAKDKMKKLKQK